VAYNLKYWQTLALAATWQDWPSIGVQCEILADIGIGCNLAVLVFKWCTMCNIGSHWHWLQLGSIGVQVAYNVKYWQTLPLAAISQDWQGVALAATCQGWYSIITGH
jgi:hypothetical protein